ncbi:DUF6355 family natural product biosynthesis protein [Saccharothrix lopnurensis]|uniref:DUF6355 family natural product biosynthesis protein n=1 Tax=Saccharothrix lopnurensis TaxID=1670621 RepID=A0ABW1P0M8_9PSEU
MKNSLKAAAVGLFALAGALAPGAANAAPADTTPAAAEMICGYAENAEAAYYGHCGDTWVHIKIDYHHGWASTYMCVPPWSETHLGSDDNISNAFYIGLC